MPAIGRSLRDFGDLFPAEQSLLKAAQDGLRCSLLNGQRNTPDARTEQNFVRATFVRFLALGGDADHPVHEKGVQLEYAWIGAAQEAGVDQNHEEVQSCSTLNYEKSLDLARCKDVLPLFLNHCGFEGNIVIEDARTRTIHLDYSIVNGGIEARGAFIDGSLYLRSLDNTVSFQAKKGMNLVDAIIKGSLECHNATFSPRESRFDTEHGTAIFASRVDISGSVFLQQTFSAGGPTVFRNARIGGNFECSGGHFDKAQIDNGKTVKVGERASRAIDCQGAKIGGGVFFRQDDKKANFNAAGEIRFIDTEIGGSFECHGAEIHNANGSALICSRMNIAGTVFLHEGFLAEGSIIFRRAAIGGNFECSGGNFTGNELNAAKPCGRLAIDCQGAKIGGSVYLRKDGTGNITEGLGDRKPFNSIGLVRFIDADVAGSFECHGAVIGNPGADALSCSRIRVGGSVLLIDGFSAEGEVSFRRANVGGNFDASNATFTNISGKALSCENVHITGHALLGVESSSSRESNNNPTKSVSDMDSTRSGDNGNRLVSTKKKYFRADGQVDFSGAQIEGDFIGEGGQFINPQRTPDESSKFDYALSLRSARISNALRLGWQKDEAETKIEGALDLRGARATIFIDSIKSWPQISLPGCAKQLPCDIYLSGFSYEYFGGNSPLKAKERQEWLLRQPIKDANLEPQPFEQLIKVLRAMGYSEEATRIAIFRESERKPGYIFPWLNIKEPFVVRKIYGWVFGYGYKWQRLFYIAVALWLVSGIIYTYNKDRAMLNNFHLTELQRVECPTSKASPNCPQFSPFKFSADAMLPLISFGERTLWKFEEPSDGGYNFLALLYQCEILFGWIFGISLGVIISKKVSRE